jgi:hypothetical protein
MDSKFSVRIRFNTNFREEDKSSKEWRVLVDGVENFCNQVRILCPSETTKDQIEGVGNKWHISCNPARIEYVKDEAAVAANFFKEIILY